LRNLLVGGGVGFPPDEVTVVMAADDGRIAVTRPAIAVADRDVQTGRDPFVHLRVAIGEVHAAKPSGMVGTRHVGPALVVHIVHLEKAVVHGAHVFLQKDDSIGRTDGRRKLGQFDVGLVAFVVALGKALGVEVAHLALHGEGAHSLAIVRGDVVGGTFVNPDLASHVGGHDARLIVGPIGVGGAAVPILVSGAAPGLGVGASQRSIGHDYVHVVGSV